MILAKFLISLFVSVIASKFSACSNDTCINRLAVGDRLPDFTFSTSKIIVSDEGISCPRPVEITTSEVFAGKTVLLVAVPGAYTPTCSEEHIPGVLTAIPELEAKGVDTVAVISTNDAFVLAHWVHSLNGTDKLLVLADGSATFTRAIGLELDLTARGMGIRSKRYAILVRDGTVAYIGVDEPGKLEFSTAQAVLEQL